MKIIYTDMSSHKTPMYCKPCAKNHSGLAQISLNEAKGIFPNQKIVCADCQKDLESD
jgi:transposase-like protein